MEVYCLHLLILASTRIFLLKFLKVEELWSVAILSGGITLVVCYIFFSKIPCKNTKLKLLFGVK